MFEISLVKSKKNLTQIDEFVYTNISLEGIDDDEDIDRSPPYKLMREERDGADVIAVTSEGKLVATGAVKIDSDIARLQNIAVGHEYRTKYGLGSLVVGTLVDRALDAGVKKVILKSFSTKQPFYAKQGFEHDKSTDLMVRELS